MMKGREEEEAGVRGRTQGEALKTGCEKISLKAKMTAKGRRKEMSMEVMHES